MTSDSAGNETFEVADLMAFALLSKLLRTYLVPTSFFVSLHYFRSSVAVFPGEFDIHSYGKEIVRKIGPAFLCI